MEEFNYCVGHYWEDEKGQINSYAYGSEVQYGTMKDAEALLEYVQSRDTKHEYKIFKVVEMVESNEK